MHQSPNRSRGVFCFPLRLETTGRDDCRSKIRRHTHHNHVLFDVLAEANACVESGGNKTPANTESGLWRFVNEHIIAMRPSSF